MDVLIKWLGTKLQYKTGSMLEVNFSLTAELFTKKANYKPKIEMNYSWIVAIIFGLALATLISGKVEFSQQRNGN